MRARNLKPGFFKNELLGEADPKVQLLFAGLWCLADRDGLLEDRPLRIKAEIFPYRAADINGELTVLSRLGFIRRFQHGAAKLIQVANFKKHQSPHHTERKSEWAVSLQESGGSPLTVNSPLENGEYPPDSLIPDSLIPDSSKRERTRRAHALPENFQPNEANKKLADQLGVDLDSAIAAFVDYHLSKGSLHKDWHRALNTWLRREKPHQSRGHYETLEEKNARLAREYALTHPAEAPDSNEEKIQ